MSCITKRSLLKLNIVVVHVQWRLVGATDGMSDKSVVVLVGQQLTSKCLRLPLAFNCTGFEWLTSREVQSANVNLLRMATKQEGVS